MQDETYGHGQICAAHVRSQDDVLGKISLQLLELLFLKLFAGSFLQLVNSAKDSCAPPLGIPVTIRYAVSDLRHNHLGSCALCATRGVARRKWQNSASRVEEMDRKTYCQNFWACARGESAAGVSLSMAEVFVQANLSSTGR